MTKYRIQLDLTDDEWSVLSKALVEAYMDLDVLGPSFLVRSLRMDPQEEANHLLRIIEELEDAGDIAETLE